MHIIKGEPGMVLESYNPSVWEVKARGSRTESNSLSLTGQSSNRQDTGLREDADSQDYR